jgi:hypothetical protein
MSAQEVKSETCDQRSFSYAFTCFLSFFGVLRNNLGVFRTPMNAAASTMQKCLPPQQ